jgi:hypothetical protein
MVGCTGLPRYRDPWTVKDSWYNKPEDKGLVWWDWEEQIVYEVDQSSQQDAQSLLAEKQITKLTIEQVNRLTGTEVEEIENHDFYLVRGVFLNEGTGEFVIYSNGKQLWVYHGSLGRSPVAMKRKALIVALDQMPDEVFVTCMMDE